MLKILVSQSAESVILIFSANKSGEYFGYARMASKINREYDSTAIPWTPPQWQEWAEAGGNAGLPKAIYTAPTETAPRGRIIDDSARGTIFWEALGDEMTAVDASGSDVGSGGGGKKTTVEWEWEEFAAGRTVPKASGKPFKVEWLSTTRLSFHRTKGLRNNLNSGREVKIARDGTELEESAGQRMVQMFHETGEAPGLSSSTGIQRGAVVI